MNERSLRSSNLRWAVVLLTLAFTLHEFTEATRAHLDSAPARTSVAAPVRHAADRLVPAATTAGVSRQRHHHRARQT